MADTNNGKSEFTGWGWLLKVGPDLAKLSPMLTEGTKVRIHGIDMNQFVDMSNTNVPHYVPNPEYPGFTFLDKSAHDSQMLADHPTILLRNASYFIIAVENKDNGF